MDEFFEIGAFLDERPEAQAAFNLDALEKVIGRKLDDRDEIVDAAAPGRALDLHRFRHGPRALQRRLEAMSPRAAERIAEAAPLFA